MHLLIVGASARAAAQSAARAGIEPCAIDLFADRDLVAVAGGSRRIEPGAYPDGLARLAEAFPPGPWMYTGALENHPDLIDRIAAGRPLCGNPGAVLRAVRDPFAVAVALRSAGLACPEVRRDPVGLPRDGAWLVKPRDSAGGRDITPIGPGLRTPADVYFQRRIPGKSGSAVFVGERTGARLLGLTRQLLGGDGFSYRGSLGPWPLPESVRSEAERIGRVLAAAFGLVGLFGVDFVLAEGRPWPVEVNPRYTASVEVLELTLGRSLLAEHVRACDPEARLPQALGVARRRPPAAVGKAILFAPRQASFPRRPRLPSIGFAVPVVADVPGRGSRFDAGEPVLTVLAGGASLEAVEARLARRLERWAERLGWAC